MPDAPEGIRGKTEAMNHSRSPLKVKRILLIEGNASLRRALQGTLEAYGHHLRAVKNAEAGLQAVYFNGYDIVICNQHLSGISGMEFFSKARTRLRYATTVLTAAIGDDYLVNTAHASGIRVFMEKPFKLEHLLECINGHSHDGSGIVNRSHVYFTNCGHVFRFAPPTRIDEKKASERCDRTVLLPIKLIDRQWKLYLNNNQQDTRPNLPPPHLELVT